MAPAELIEDEAPRLTAARLHEFLHQASARIGADLDSLAKELDKHPVPAERKN